MHRRAETLPILTALLVLAACSSMPSSDGGASSTRAETPRAEDGSAGQGAADTGRAQPDSREADSSDADAAVDTDAPAEAMSLVDQVLADRRRGDYPEIEADEAGFTITEQVRIAGDARDRYDRAMLLLSQERYAEGIPLLVEVTEMAPGVTTPYVDLAIAYGNTGDLERARETLESAALLSPEHPLVHNELGIVYRRIGRFADARASYERALAVYSGFHFARRNLAVLCDLYLADSACALEHYEAYLDAVGEDREVEIWVADIRNRLGQDGGS